MNENQQYVEQIVSLTEAMRTMFHDCRMASFELTKVQSAVGRLADKIQPEPPKEVKAALTEVKNA